MAGSKRAGSKRAGSKRARDAADAGGELERRVARLEFAEGAFVQLRVPVGVSVNGDKEILTDIDVLSLDFDGRLREARNMLECKSSRGQGGEADRLFWLAGFQEFVGADRAVLVREMVSARGRRLAEKLQLETFDIVTLERREQEHAWLPPTFAHVGGSECARVERRSATQLKALGEFSPNLTFALWNEALVGEPHTILGTLVTLGRTVEGMAVLPDPAGETVAGHALVGLILAALRAGAQLDEVSPPELSTELGVGLMTGDPRDKQVLRILGVADALFHREAESIHDAYVEGGAERVARPLVSVREAVSERPPWIARFVDLAERYRANPSIARTLPQTAELACFDALPGDQNWSAECFNYLFSPEHRQLLAVTIDALGAISGFAVSERVNGVLELPFDRRHPELPERRKAYSPPASRSREHYNKGQSRLI